MRKILILTAILFLILGAIAYRYYDLQRLSNLKAGVLTINETPIVVEIANNSATRVRGLSGRDLLPEKSGMLFVFPKADFYEFWMKDMKFPIDIVWFDDSWKIIDIKENIQPETYPEVSTSKEKARYAVEVNAGFAKKYEIKIGDQASFEKH